MRTGCEAAPSGSLWRVKIPTRAESQHKHQDCCEDAKESVPLAARF